MDINLTLNGWPVMGSAPPGLSLLDFLREKGCLSVKCACCETSNCGACTVLLDGAPVLSCSVLAARAGGRAVDTLEGLQAEAEPIAAFLAAQGIFAVESAVNELAETLGMNPAALREKNAELLGCAPEDTEFDGDRVRRLDTGASATLAQAAYRARSTTASVWRPPPPTPPPSPFIAGMAEVEVDKLTGQVSVLDYMAVVDCGIPINPALAHAIYRATGVWHRFLPITPEKIALGTPDAC